jgi:anti-sigma B factor antagonist
MELEASMIDDGIKLIRLAGRLDMKSTLLIDSRFSAEVTSGASRILVDISGVEFLASIGIRLLVVGAKTVGGQGGQLVLCCPQPAVAKTLAVTGIDTLIPIYDEKADAVNGLRSA